jgi:hypothetical protein
MHPMARHGGDLALWSFRLTVDGIEEGTCKKQMTGRGVLPIHPSVPNARSPHPSSP